MIFLYGGFFPNLNSKNALEILLTKDFFQIENYNSLINHCEFIINTINESDCLQVIELAFKFNQEELIKKSISIAALNYKNIKNNKEFKELDSQIIIKIQDETINNLNEMNEINEKIKNFF